MAPGPSAGLFAVVVGVLLGRYTPELPSGEQAAGWFEAAPVENSTHCVPCPETGRERIVAAAGLIFLTGVVVGRCSRRCCRGKTTGAKTEAPETRRSRRIEPAFNFVSSRDVDDGSSQ